jgi:hypothetical protein
MYKSILLSAALCFSSVAFATPGGEGNNTNCNGVGNPNSPCVPSVKPPDNGSVNSSNKNTNTNTINSNNKTYRYDNSVTDNSIKNTNTAYGGAGGQGGDGGDGFGLGIGVGVGGSSNSASNSVSNAAGGNSVATGGNSSAAGGSSSSSSSGGNATGGNAAGGNAMINYNVPAEQRIYSHASGTTRVENTPDTMAPSGVPTAPCIVPISGAFGIPGLGGSVGGYVKDHTCTAMEIRRTTTNTRIIRKADQYLENELDDMLLGQAKRKEGRMAREVSNPFGY